MQAGASGGSFGACGSSATHGGAPVTWEATWTESREFMIPYGDDSVHLFVLMSSAAKGFNARSTIECLNAKNMP